MNPDDSLEGLDDLLQSAWSGGEKPAPGEQAGDRIDRYKLLEEIGEGGMGSVWMAEQREPVQRKVALKIIKLGMDTREVVVLPHEVGLRDPSSRRTACIGSTARGRSMAGDSTARRGDPAPAGGRARSRRRSQRHPRRVARMIHLAVFSCLVGCASTHLERNKQIGATTTSWPSSKPTCGPFPTGDW